LRRAGIEYHTYNRVAWRVYSIKFVERNFWKQEEDALTTVVHESYNNVYCYDYFTLSYLVLYCNGIVTRKNGIYIYIEREREGERGGAASPNVA
jgi:hypothetical protein